MSHYDACAGFSRFLKSSNGNSLFGESGEKHLPITIVGEGPDIVL